MVFSVAESYLIYFLTFLTSSSFFWLSGKFGGVFKYLCRFLSATVLAGMSAYRGLEVGTDYIFYTIHFRQMIEKVNTPFDFNLLDFKFEPGYNLLVFLIARITNNIQIVSFIVYLFIAILVQIGLRKILDKRYYFLGLLFYLTAFWLYGFNGLRQSIALGFVLISFSYLIRRRAAFYILSTFAAMSFHLSAIVMLPIYFIFKKEGSVLNKNDLILIFCFGIGVIFFENIVNHLGYGGYFSENEEESLFIILKAFQSIIMLIPFILLSFKFRSDSIIKYGPKIIFIISIFVGMGVFGRVVMRLTFFFEIFLVPLAIYIIISLNNRKSSYRPLWFFYVTLYFFAYRFLYVYYGSGKVIPYSITGM